MTRLFGAGCPCCEGLPRGDTGGAAHGVSRRGFMAAAVGVAAAALAPPALAQNSGTQNGEVQDGGPRVLRVRRQVVGDSFSGVYWRDGRYDRDALRQLDNVFRDLSAAETTPMDPRLFDVMSTLARTLDSDETYEVVSGYRTPETNARNAGRSRRVSTVSLHMSGMAADCRLPGRQGMGLARVASELQLGGVGLYSRDGFVHLDCGPVRRW